MPAGLLGGAVGAALIVLLAMRIATRERAVLRAKDQTIAALLETRVFFDSPRRVGSAALRGLGWSLRYVGATLPAFVLAAVPVGRIAVALDLRYGRVPLAAHEDITVRIETADSACCTVVPQAGIALGPGPVYVEALGAAYVRLRAETGRHTLRLREGERTIDKVIAVGPGLASPEVRRGLANWLAIGAEPALPPDSAIRRIAIEQETSPRRYAGLPWWAVFLLVSTAATLLLARPLRVTV
jgi:hypothetical protein